MTVTEVYEPDHTSRPLLRHGQWRLVRSMGGQALRSRYRQSSLSFFWNIAQQVMYVGVFAIVFSQILKVDGGEFPYLSFILAGLICWKFLAGGLGTVTALTDQLFLVTKVYFPRELIPMANVLTGTVDLGVGLILMIIVAWVQGHPPQVFLLALPLPILLLLMVTTALSIVATTVAAFVRDLAHAMPMVVQLGFFATPVMYPPSQLPSWLSWLGTVNPISVVIESIRSILLGGRWPNWLLLFVHLVLAAGAVLASIAYVRSVEHRLVDII